MSRTISFSTSKIIFIASGVILVIALLALFMQAKDLIFKQSDAFTQSTVGLGEAKEAEVIVLEDGDEYQLEASYVVKDIGNRRVRMIAYNGSVPGPFFKVTQGGEITIHFTNNLDIETTIHSHGLRLDFPFDGTPGVSQEAIKPGETFTYKLKFPDAGTYWYHPHVREDYAQELGAYGNYLVEPTDYTLPPVNQELNLIVDDILFEGDEQPPFYRNRTNFAIMGRFGNVMLVNGRTDYSETFNAGDIIRLNITNTANARPFELSVPGARMKLVASDLSPYEREEFVDNILITPSERYTVDVYFDEAGEYILQHESHDLALGNKKYEMAQFIVSENTSTQSYLQEFETLHEYPEVITAANSFVEEFLYKRPDKSITLNLDPGALDLASGMEALPCHRMPDGTWMGECTPEKQDAWLQGLSAEESSLGGEKIHWEDHTYELNRETSNLDITWEIIDDNTELANHHINDWKFEVGDVIKMRVFNDPLSAHPMQHPFHTHGQRMMAIAVNGEEIENKVWKDSILIPVGDTVDIIIEFSNPGIWMAHCHIAEHLASGMMFNFAVGGEYFDMLDEVEAEMHERHLKEGIGGAPQEQSSQNLQ